jgi:hypothetical protein
MNFRSEGVYNVRTKAVAKIWVFIVHKADCYLSFIQEVSYQIDFFFVYLFIL